MTISTWRFRALERCEQEGMPVQMTLAIDAAAAQYAGSCIEQYDLFVREGIESWKRNPGATPVEVLTDAGLPMPIRRPAAGDSAVEQGEEAIARATRRQRRLNKRDKRTICPKCRSMKHMSVPLEQQRRSADEGATPFRQCRNPDCQHTWNTEKEKV